MSDTSWGSQEAAIGLRDVIGAIAEKKINDLRPTPSYATVITINREARSATVLYMDDPTPVTVAMGSIEPAASGQTVRVGGLMGHRYIEDVLGNALMSGNDSRYAQVGHTHAGGGAVELDLNDLGDVDTETNPPDGDSVLGWNDVGGYWEPISIDLGTSYLPLTGGTVSGLVNLNGGFAAIGASSVAGALSATSFAGVGTLLTNLNAAALASGVIPVGRFPSTIGSNTTGSAAAWTTGRLLTVDGDMTGSVTIKGDADMTLSVALQPNSIALGTDTTGNYVANVVGTANQVISDTIVAGEGTIHTLSLPQNIHSAATPTFSRLTLGVATGTAPMVIASTTLIANLNADLLDGQHGTYYQNAGNLNAGTIASARLAGAYTGITGLGTLATLTVTGAAAFTANPTVGGQGVWHAGNDGAGSGLDAGLLGGVLPAGYAAMDIVEALMGDLLAVGLYDAASYNGDLFSLVFNRPTQTQMTGLTIAAGDHPLSASFAIDLPSIPQADVATGENRRRLIRNGVFLDVARTGDDAHLLRATGSASTPNSPGLDRATGFTIRARVRKTDLDAAGIKQIARHGSGTTNEAWTLYMDTGKLVFRCSANGSTMVTTDVLTAVELDAIAGTADGTDFYVAVVVTLTGTLVECRGWSSVNGVTWATAAAVKTSALVATSLFATTADVAIGGAAADSQSWDGRIYWVDQLNDVDPNGTDNPAFRFDASNGVFPSGTTFTDPYNMVWTLTSSTAIVHPFYRLVGQLVTSGGTRSVISADFAYTDNVDKPWHVRITWNPTTDVLAVAQRSGGGLALTAVSPAWTETTATFATETMSTIGAVVIGQGTSSSLNWSFGGRMYRALIVKNSVTLLDVSNTDLTVAGQTSITPTTGPAMTLSSPAMALTTRPKPVWAEGPTVYRHNMYWIVASSGEVDFIDSDFSGRYEIDADDAVTVSNGDWIIAIDPLFGSPGHLEGANLALGQMTFQYIPFSTETFVKAQIQEHLNDPLDPHSAAGYLKTTIANALYAPLIHSHGAEISGYISLHEQASDPHPQYLTETDGDGRYIRPGDIQPYEPLGAVLAHEQKSDPHPQYVTHAEGNEAYAVVDHLHTGVYSPTGHTHTTDYEVIATDGAQSARIFVGASAPVGPRVGDIWIETFDISLQPPSAPAGLTISTVTPTTITVSWAPWDPTVTQTSVVVERSPDGTTGWTNIFTDAVTPYVTTYTDTGRAERTTYFYRVRAANAIGAGAYGTISAATGNAPPTVPGSLSISSVTSSSFRFNWGAVTMPGNDPLHATQPYEVFRNGVFVATTTALFYDISGLSENTASTMGVRTKDNVGLTSAIASIGATTSNANPPAPAGLGFTGATYSTVNMFWTGVTGIADLSRYQCFVNGVHAGDSYGNSFNFTGLAPSTSYTFGVRTVDIYGAVSGISTIGGSTPAVPDSTPPAASTFHSWQPRNAYGNMYFEFTSAGDAAYGEIYYNINGAGWTLAYAGGIAGYHLFYMGNFSPGQTVYAAVNVRDAAGNWTYSPHYAYTLVPSPTTFSPHGSNSWRGSNGGEWNAAGGYKLYQGYYSNSALNSVGFWFYGSDFSDWWQNGRTIVSGYIYMVREGCGNNLQDEIVLWVHQIGESPGTTAFSGPIPYLAGGAAAGTLQYGEGKWMGVDATWCTQMCQGMWRGFAVYEPGGKPYMCLYPAGTANSGLVSLNHLG